MTGEVTGDKPMGNCSTCRYRSKWLNGVPIFSCREVCFRRNSVKTPFPLYEPEQRASGDVLADEHAEFIRRWYRDVFMHGYKHGREKR